jgi:peptidoglycan hydrolase-like protein with peptidoglycan-binding domain
MNNLKWIKRFGISTLVIIALLFASIPTQTSAITFVREMQFGMRGNDISMLQGFLATDPSLYPEGLVTGYFGTLTRAAVARYQVKNGLPAVGRVGPRTLAMINQQMASGSIGGFDDQAPIISSVTVNTTNSSATLSWNTSENAMGQVHYTNGSLVLTEATDTSKMSVSGSIVVANTDLRVGHSVTITGLQSNTRYTYLIYVRDAAGNETVTWPTTFQTR